MKQPSWKIPLILSALLLIFGTFTYWLQYSHKPKHDRAEAANKKPLSLPSDTTQIIQFRIKGAAQVIEGKCESLAKKTCTPSTLGEWLVTYPAQVKGDSDAIKSFLSNITSMAATDTVDLTSETPEKVKTLLDEYGLSPEKRTKMGTEFVELTLENGTKMAAWFGELHPVGDKVFVGASENGNLNEKTIFLISNFYKADFDKTLTHFRDKTLLTFNREDITEFEARTSAGKLNGVLEKGMWKINGKAGDYDRIETVLATLSQSKAKDFPAEDVLKGAHSLVDYHLKSKSGNYSFELFEKTTPALKEKGKEISPAKSRYYAKTSGLKEVVEVEPILRSQLDKKVSELRQATLLSQTEKATATSVKLESSQLKAPALFHYDGKAWTAKDPALHLAPAKASALLDLLSSERALDIVSPLPASGSDRLTLTMGDDKNPSKARLAFYLSKDAKKAYAQDLTQNSNEAYLLDEAVKNALPFKVDSWKIK